MDSLNVVKRKEERLVKSASTGNKTLSHVLTCDYLIIGLPKPVTGVARQLPTLRLVVSASSTGCVFYELHKIIITVLLY